MICIGDSIVNWLIEVGFVFMNLKLLRERERERVEIVMNRYNGIESESESK